MKSKKFNLTDWFAKNLPLFSLVFTLLALFLLPITEGVIIAVFFICINYINFMRVKDISKQKVEKKRE